MNPVPEKPVRITDLAEGLSLISRNGLCLADETISHVQTFYESGRDPEGRHGVTGDRVLAIWLVHCAGVPVGMATVSQEHEGALDEYPFHYQLLNVYVKPDHAGKGLGKQLIQEAQAAHPQVYGHYTTDSIALYEKMGMRDVSFVRHEDPDGEDPRTIHSVLRRHASLHRLRWGGQGDPPHHGRSAHTTPFPKLISLQEDEALPAAPLPPGNRRRPRTAR